MSYAINPLNTVVVKDPIIRVNNKRDYAIVEGGQRVSWKVIKSTNVSDSAISFTAPPPSPGIFVKREVLFRCPLRFEITGKAPAAAGGNPAQTLLQTGFDAIRAYALSQIINTLQATINNNSSSINMSDTIGAFLRYQTGHDLRYHKYSMTPTMLDNYQQYADGAGTVRNPLGGYFDNSYELGRGGFPIKVIQNPDGLGTDPADPTITAIFEAELTEPLFLSPYFFGKGQTAGFLGIQTLDYTFNMADLSRAYCHSVASGAVIEDDGVKVSIKDVTLFEAPALLFQYVTPKVLQPLPAEGVVYPYYSVDRYPSDINSFAIGEQRRVSSQNIQLQSIPKRMYIYARRRNSVQTFKTTDTFMAIEGINVNWNNNNSLLSAATPQQLYNISVKNGCDMSWSEWSGREVQRFGTGNPEFNLCGSVLALEFGTDIGLGPLECAGMLGTYQLQIDVNLKNIAGETLLPTLYIVVVSEGTYTIKQNQSIAQVGVVSKQDVLDSNKDMEIPFSEIEDSQYGGNFYSGLKRLGEDIVSGAKKAMPVVKDIAGIAEKVAPLVAPLLMAAGEEGGVVVGGRKKGGQVVSRMDLRKRLMY